MVVVVEKEEGEEAVTNRVATRKTKLVLMIGLGNIFT